MAGGWRARADEAFLVAMPGRRRVALEVALVVLVVFGESVVVEWASAALVVLAATLALALALVRPWAAVHGGIAGRAAATVAVLVAVVVPAIVAREPAGLTRRLGVVIVAGSPAPGDPPVPGGIVLVDSVAPGTPADGVLRAGDRIVAIGGEALDPADAPADLTRRTHGDALPEDTTVTVLRDGATADLPVHVPRVKSWRRSLGQGFAGVRVAVEKHIVVASAVRGALVILLLLLLVRADGQPLLALGIARKGALAELAASTWMTMGTFGVQIAVAIPIGVIGVLTGAIEREATRRTEALGTIANQGSVLEFLAGVLVAAAFEEVAFRAFLTPRVRTLTGSWPWSVALVSVVFGMGHTYEGTLAVVQTAFLGAYFSVVYLARRRLLGPWIAHAAFNTGMFLLLRVLSAPGLLDRLKSMAPPR